MPLIEEGVASVATLWRLFMLRPGELIAVRAVRLIAKKALSFL